MNHPSSQPLPQFYFEDVKNDVGNVFFVQNIGVSRKSHWGSLKQKFGRMGLVQFETNVVSEVAFPNLKLGNKERIEVAN